MTDTLWTYIYRHPTHPDGRWQHDRPCYEGGGDAMTSQEFAERLTDERGSRLGRMTLDRMPERLGYATFLIRALMGHEQAPLEVTRQMAEEWLANEERIRNERKGVAS